MHQNHKITCKCILNFLNLSLSEIKKSPDSRNMRIKNSFWKSVVLQCVSTALLVLLKEQEHVVLELIAVSDTGKYCNST